MLSACYRWNQAYDARNRILHMIKVAAAETEWTLLPKFSGYRKIYIYIGLYVSQGNRRQHLDNFFIA